MFIIGLNVWELTHKIPNNNHSWPDNYVTSMKPQRSFQRWQRAPLFLFFPYCKALIYSVLYLEIRKLVIHVFQANEVVISLFKCEITLVFQILK